MSDTRDEDKIIVITMRCIDSVAHFADIDRVECGICGEMTWLSANWRGRKIDKIVCKHCFEEGKYKDDDDDEDDSFNTTDVCLNDAIKLLRERYDVKGTDEEIRKRLIETMEEEIGQKINIVK